jgi:long-chain fatty acid transport protein
MGRAGTRGLLLIGSFVGMLFPNATAEAGGFAIREQSTSGLGAAFAGVAAGYDLSSIFWNSAGVSVARGVEGEADGAVILPDRQISGTASLEPIPPLQPFLGPSVPLSFLDSDGGDLADPAFPAAMYGSMPLSNKLTIGFGFNAPFGLVTEPENDNWAGKFEARTSKLRTYNFNPVAAYRITPNLIFGAGPQIEFADVKLKSAFPGIGGLAGPNPNVVIDGDDWAAGYTLGVLWYLPTGTDIGVGFRSSIEHTVEGDIFVTGIGAGLGSARTTADLELPEIVTGSVRQQLSKRLTLLGTVEWTEWSVLDQVVVRARSSNPNLGAIAGTPVAVFPLNWHDGWFFSGGAEFEVNERSTIRAGAAFEESPIQNATERTARDPDSNRIWLSVGGTYNWSPSTTISLAYSHVFFEDGSIDRTSSIPGLGQVRFLGQAEGDVDIVALSVRMRFGRGAMPPLSK